MRKITPKKFQKRGPGIWVEKPRRCEILTCLCGNKYLKTREGQAVCIKCINKLNVDEIKVAK